MDKKPRISGDLQLPPDTSQGLPITAAPQLSRRLLSRRVLLKVAGVLGVGIGAGAVGRLTYLLARNQTLFTYRGHSYGIDALAWSPNSRWIASAGGDVHVWEALTGQLIHSFPDREGVESVAWSPDGKYLAIGSWDNTASVWDVVTAQKILTYRGHERSQSAAIFSQFDLAARQDRTELRPSSPRLSGILSLAWSPDGTRLLSSGRDRTSQVWEALTGQTLLKFGGESDYYAEGAWSPDNKRLATAGLDLKVQVWDAASGQTQYTYWGHLNLFQKFFSEPLVDHPAAPMQGASLLLPQDTGSPPASVDALAWSPNGRYIASGGSDTTVQVWQPG